MQKKQFGKILVIRTDRIGDVLLSTPVFANLRKSFPNAHLAAMVTPYAKEIVEGNPNIDEVIIYDPKSKHKGWLSSIRFARDLRKKKFDVALVLHPTNRAHIVSFISGIKDRIGYDRKFAFLLTKRAAHLKQKGEKHERDYALDLLKELGVEPEKSMPFMPIRKESEDWALNLMNSFGLDPKQEKIVAIHAGASCISKRWPVESFANVAQRLINEKKAKVVLVGANTDMELSGRLIKLIDSDSAVDLVGKTSVSRLASLLKRCKLFISNDSGPVHIASSVGTPVISIFGRNQPGLGPKRWGPLGKQDKFVHKNAGCLVCLAHNCNKGFLCLKAITTQEIVSLAESLL